MSHLAPSNAKPIRLTATRSHQEARNSLISSALKLNLMPFDEDPQCSDVVWAGGPKIATKGSHTPTGDCRARPPTPGVSACPRCDNQHAHETLCRKATQANRTFS